MKLSLALVVLFTLVQVMTCKPEAAKEPEKRVANREEEGVANRDEKKVANRNEEGVANRDEKKVANRDEEGVANRDKKKVANRNEEGVANRDEKKVANRDEEGVANRDKKKVANRDEEGVANREEEGGVVKELNKRFQLVGQLLSFLFATLQTLLGGGLFGTGGLFGNLFGGRIPCG